MLFLLPGVFTFPIVLPESYSLDPDQARHLDGPDLGPNCLQRLSADGTGSLSGEELIIEVEY